MAGRPDPITNCTICGAAPVKARGWCSQHYTSWLRHGRADWIDEHLAGLVERTVDDDGYVWIRVGQRLRLEHREVAAAVHGDLEGRIVHHINGLKVDNRPDNLVVVDDQSAHSLLHVSLEKAAFLLVQQGVIAFDRTTNTYLLDDQACADAA